MCAKRTSTTKKRARSPEVAQKATKAQSAQDLVLNDEYASKRVKMAQPATSKQALNETDLASINRKKVANDAIEAAKAAKLPATAQANLTGKFDLYATSLSRFNKVYKPEGDATLHAEELYHTITKYQARGDKTATVYLPDESSEASDGKFKLGPGGVCDKFRDDPYKIAVSGFSVIEEVEQTYSYEYPRPDDAWSGSGLATTLGLKKEVCYGPRSSGELELRPLWRKKENGKVMELFEGTFWLSIEYQRMFDKHNVLPKDVDIGSSLWAVRAIPNLEDDDDDEEDASEAASGDGDSDIENVAY